jgi:GT2 family glycosyltransferase
MRAKPLLNLLNSVNNQTCYPDEILIIDGSTNNETKIALEQNKFNKLNYFQVSPDHRGLTKQRNFGISKIGDDMKIICFLDDDTILEKEYFESLLNVYKDNPDAVGVGGVAINENKWRFNDKGVKKSAKYYTIDNYYVKESTRNYLRNLLGLGSNEMPGVMPEYSNGKTCGYPLNGKTYPVDLVIGMSMNFTREVVNKIKFSTYFEGYGLYEDADFSLRAIQLGQNYVATSVQLSHYHDGSGRPNKFSYGKMVVRNGWYVWRVKYPKPSLKARFKWNLIVFLLTIIRFSNTFTTSDRKAAFTESLGRTVGWFSLIFNKPKIRK